MMTTSLLSPAQHADLLRLRAMRTEDERVRFTLSLVRHALRYGPYGQDPYWLYRSTSTGRFYVQARLGEYKTVDYWGAPEMGAIDGTESVTS